MKPTSTFTLTAMAILAWLPFAASAQSSMNEGYLVDSSGRVVTSAVSGQCWHTGEWTPALAIEPCDPTIKRAAAAPVPQPEPLASPMAAPVAVVPAPPPQKMSFSADALFAFDKSALKPEGKTMLDGLATQLEGANYEVLTVTGHADRLGSAKYNQKLSERRANEVKTYLVTKNIPADRITASGMGESQPVTQAADCRGPQTAKLIACLQPDRRVDVEVKGTRTVNNAK